MIESVQNLLESHIASGSTLGVAALLVRDGRTVFHLTLGERATGAPMPADAALAWLSAGKPLTAVAIAMLHEQHCLNIEDKVVRYVPEFAQADKSALTIRHLLTHTAGLHQSLPANWHSANWDEIVNHIATLPVAPGFVPGEMAAYDPAASWFILGEIIQRITHEPFEDYMRQRIFAPANMPSAAFSAQGQQGHVATPTALLIPYYNTQSSPPNRLPWSVPNPASANIPRPGASLRAPITEMAHFYQSLMAGELIGMETLKCFTSPSRGLLADKTFGQAMDWGLGIMVNNTPRRAYNFGPTTSPNAFGHGGQQSSLAFFDPARNTFFAVNYNGLCGELQHNLRMRELLALL